jgi:hypothetical protein
MASSGMLRRVALVRIDVSEELSASFIRVTRISELGTGSSVHQLLVTASVVPSSPILVTLMKEVLSSSETSVLTRATRRNIPEDATLHSHRRENLKSYNYRLCFSNWSFSCTWGEPRTMVRSGTVVVAASCEGGGSTVNKSITRVHTSYNVYLSWCSQPKPSHIIRQIQYSGQYVYPPPK